MKNVVMNIVMHIRERKKRPNLWQFMAVYKEQKSMAVEEYDGETEEERMKKFKGTEAEKAFNEDFQEKMRIFYSGEPIDDDEPDPQYD